MKNARKLWSDEKLRGIKKTERERERERVVKNIIKNAKQMCCK